MTTSEKLFRKDPLRIGLLTDTYSKPRWVHKIISDINASTVADIVVVVKEEGLAEKKQQSFQKIWSQRKHWLYKLYTRADNFIFKVQTDAFTRSSIADLIPDCPVMGMTPNRKKYSDKYNDEDVALVLEHQLDVMLYLGRRILKGKMLQAARYGVWSYHHGDNLVNRGGPPGFWEVMEGHPTTGSILQILTEDLDGGQVIYRSYAPTHRRSVKRNKNNYYWKSTAFVQRKLEELYQYGPEALQHDPYACNYHPYSQRLYKNPTNSELIPLLLKFSVKHGVDKLKELLYLKQWFLAYRIGPRTTEVEHSFYRFKPIFPPKDRYWADPFPVKRDDKYYIFIEEYIRKDKKGHIAVIEMDQKGRYQQPTKILEKNYHLSYPFIFQWRGDTYMIPESAQNRTIELYRCVSFPDDWRLEAVLMEGVKAVDTTLAEINGLWWMFVNIGVDGTTHSHDELHLFYAETPLGPWQPHRSNPVKSDARSARPAGHLFRWRGDLYRPAQDCSKLYGYAISINKIAHICPDRFVEIEVSKIFPQWSNNLFATHTFNRADGLAIVDGLYETRKL